MVPGPAVEDEKMAYTERATAAAENSNIEEITGMDTRSTGVNPKEITTYVYDLPIIKDDEDSNKYNNTNGEDDDSGKYEYSNTDNDNNEE